jgi:hypothetical protein
VIDSKLSVSAMFIGFGIVGSISFGRSHSSGSLMPFHFIILSTFTLISSLLACKRGVDLLDLLTKLKDSSLFLAAYNISCILKQEGDYLLSCDI